MPRPAFAREYPRSPGLDALVDAFAHGDYARVRAEALLVERSSDDAAVKAATRELVERTQPDRLAVVLLVLATLLLVVFATWAVAHGHAPARG